MLLAKAREEIASRCAAFGSDGLVVATSGNMSIRQGELVAITPTGVDYHTITPQDVVVMDLEGTVVDGDLKPSSEWELHLGALRATQDASVVHTHSPNATAVACLDGIREVPAVHYYVAMFGGTTLPVAPYARYGTPELAHQVEQVLADHTGALMANHGAVVTGPDLAGAYVKAQEVEWLCDVYLKTLTAGRPSILSQTQVQTVIDALDSYGQ